MSEDVFEIEVEIQGASAAVAIRATDELLRWLRDNAPTLPVERRSNSPQAQDAGTILTVILGSASAVAFFKGLARVMEKQGSRVVVRKKNGEEVIASGDSTIVLADGTMVTTGDGEVNENVVRYLPRRKG
jgi:hypothetical protein